HRILWTVCSVLTDGKDRDPAESQCRLNLIPIQLERGGTATRRGKSWGQKISGAVEPGYDKSTKRRSITTTTAIQDAAAKHEHQTIERLTSIHRESPGNN